MKSRGNIKSTGLENPWEKLNLKTNKHLLILLLIFLIAPLAHARQAKLEVQLSQFKLESLAERYAKDLSYLDRPVFVKAVESSGGETYYTVRTGPFDSPEKALSFINEWTPMLAEKPVAMAADSLEPIQLPQLVSTEQSPKKETSAAQADVSTKTPRKKPTKIAAAQTPKASSDPEDNESEKSGQKAADAEEGDSGFLWGASDEADGHDTQVSGTASGGATAPTGDLRRQVRDLQEQVKTLMDAEEVRSELQATEEEKEEEKEDILSAAGRNYTLLEKGRLGVEYKLDYSYFAYDSLREQNIIEHHSNHNIKNTFTMEYPLKDNLTVEAAVPFSYKYDKVGTGASKEISDLSDVDFSLNYQPIQSGVGFPSIIFRGILTAPLGRDPYDINPDTELSTGSGGYAGQGSLSVSQTVDPIMVYGTVGYTYKHPIKDLDYKLGSQTLTRYDRGDTVEFSMGIGYAFSYITSLTMGYSYAYTFEAERFFKEADSQTYATRVQSSLAIGTSWRISKKLRINSTLQIGLANSSYFSLSFRFPYEFDL